MMQIWVAITSALTLCAAPIASALGPAPDDTVIWATICTSGQTRLIAIDISGDGDAPLPQAPHSKACHAVCCQRDDDSTEADQPELEPAD